ncbi:MAG TPA: hypothetical protein VFC46_03570, partial [Humisphaera sp.]|nr:hypothetical protein [Humisphaera sp.]
VMIDIDGIRQRRWTALGINRLLKSLREVNKQYSVPDSLSLCQGYAPTAARKRPDTIEKPLAVETPANPGDNDANAE